MAFEGILARLRRSSPRSRLIGRLLIAAGSAYLLYTLVGGLGQLSEQDWRRYAQASAAGLVLYPIAVLSQALAWALALHWLHRQRVGIEARDLAIFASSHLARRLPGGVWHLVTRVARYRDQGVATRVPLLASLGELAALLLASAAVYLALAFLPFAADPPKVASAVAAAAAAGWLTGRVVARTTRGGLVYVLIAELYVLALATGGAILWVFLVAAGAPEVSLMRATATWALVAGVGTVIGLVPGSFGVREITLGVVLTSYLSAPGPAVIAVLFRLLFTAGDLIWGAALLLATRRSTV